MLLFRLNGFSAAVCSVLLAVTLAACGGGGSASPEVASSPDTLTNSATAVTPSTTAAPTTPAAPAAPVTPVLPTSPTTPATDTAAACDKTNAKVGQVANLSTRSHGVSGKATVIDNCTIEIRNFSYDGGGLSKVFVYGGKAGNYVAGFPIGINLRGTAFANQTLTVRLNPGDLDKLDGISIWCSDANANFGDGRFAPA